ncbi:hypothetical protein ANAPRD1_01296 [Anaplasma phagocytophilum]|nr:hypothetical protein ANAPH2_01189 [Anaplasma phagocytophilum]SCV66779.1 hypothetical protein ANAPRD1_01296 [Anaplasma phagocytophilum]
MKGVYGFRHYSAASCVAFNGSGLCKGFCKGSLGDRGVGCGYLRYHIAR